MFVFTVQRATPLSLGLLNLKWKVETSTGSYVLKQFSKKRYERYPPAQIIQQQHLALKEQIRQHEYGTACPQVLMHHGEVIHMSPAGERFVVMTFVQGENLPPGGLNEDQMYSLGRATAHMHNVFQTKTDIAPQEPKFIPPSIDERLQTWYARLTENEDNEQLSSLIRAQILATEQFDWAALSSCDPGWAHRDLWVDNLLFRGNQLSAILDFDRLAYDYPELDIARAIMSGSLRDQELNPQLAMAFLAGYRTKRKLIQGTLVRSLQLLWYMESIWWITPDLNHSRYQEVQFQNEMSWLAENLGQLTSIFGAC